MKLHIAHSRACASLAACMAAMLVLPSAAGAQTLQALSSGKTIHIEIHAMPQPAPLGQMLAPDLRLTDSSGKPLRVQSIALTGLRIYTRNELPTLPLVTAMPEPGHYRISGLRFHIAGQWRLTFAIKSETLEDKIDLQVLVK